MADNDFRNTVETLFKGMDSFITSKTVVGDAVQVGADTYVIPLIDVSFGVGAGAFAGNKKDNGGGGMGGKMNPSAVLVISNGTTKLIDVKSNDGLGKILDMVKEYNCDTIVIGLNVGLNGEDTPQTQKVREFRTMLENKMRSTAMKGIECVWQDERFTTVIAERVLIEANVRREDRKKYVDKQAASIILQSYLDSKH